MALVPFYKYPSEFWNSCYEIFSDETKVLANPSDLCFLVDGYLVLIQEPSTKANLILQSISQHLHSISPIKHIYKICTVLASHGVTSDTDFFVTVQKINDQDKWITMYAKDVRTNRFFVNTKNNETWLGWQEITT